MNHQGLLWNVHCNVTVVLRKQLNFKGAVIRSKRSSCIYMKDEVGISMKQNNVNCHISGVYTSHVHVAVGVTVLQSMYNLHVLSAVHVFQVVKNVLSFTWYHIQVILGDFHVGNGISIPGLASVDMLYVTSPCLVHESLPLP